MNRSGFDGSGVCRKECWLRKDVKTVRQLKLLQAAALAGSKKRSSLAWVNDGPAVFLIMLNSTALTSMCARVGPDAIPQRRQSLLTSFGSRCGTLFDWFRGEVDPLLAMSL